MLKVVSIKLLHGMHGQQLTERITLAGVCECHFRLLHAVDDSLIDTRVQVRHAIAERFVDGAEGARNQVRRHLLAQRRVPAMTSARPL